MTRLNIHKINMNPRATSGIHRNGLVKMNVTIRLTSANTPMMIVHTIANPMMMVNSFRMILPCQFL